jgi:hypothetical protein
MIRLGTTTPLLFENKLFISFSKDWIEKFDSIPQFEISIDEKKRLCLKSIEEIKDDVR